MKIDPGRGFTRSLLVVGLAGLTSILLPGCGGNDSSGGGGAGTGGSAQPGSGGQTGSGGVAATGGTTGSGGVSASGSATSSSGGATGSGGGVVSGGATGSGGVIPGGGATGGGGRTVSGGATGSGAATGSSGVTTSSGGVTASNGGATGSGGETGSGGATGTDGGMTAPDVSVSDKFIVAMLQSTKANASDLSTSDVADLVGDAVNQAGGLDFIKDGMTVVLKPNLVTAYTDRYRMSAASQTVNGIATDWRVAKAVADLVRAKVGSTGKILVMEGSTMPTPDAFKNLGYTKTNISAVDEFIALEGSSCLDRTTTGLVQKAGKSGTEYWINKRYVEADIVISLPTMKTHQGAGITGGVKNLGIGVTPMGQYSLLTDASATYDCTRGQTAGANSIDHSTPETLGAFIRDYYSIRPADFVVMDGLQGIEHGPAPAFEAKPNDAGYWDYASCKKNMRLILAGRNAVAVDTVEALIMMCDPTKVPHLTMLEADGLGTADISQITVVGKQIEQVATPFACLLTDICPGK
jgi:uncharacterized protein (DUF362 family)